MSPTSGYHTGRAPMGGQVAMSLIKQLLAIYQNDQEELINDIRLISSHSVAHSVSSRESIFSASTPSTRSVRTGISRDSSAFSLYSIESSNSFGSTSDISHHSHWQPDAVPSAVPEYVSAPPPVPRPTPSAPASESSWQAPTTFSIQESVIPEDGDGSQAPEQKKAYGCPLCFEFGIADGASRVPDLRRHFKTIHTTNTQWVCQFRGCTAVFDWRLGYEAHMKQAHKGTHTGVKVYTDKLCPQVVYACGIVNCKAVFEVPDTGVHQPPQSELEKVEKEYFNHVATHFKDGNTSLSDWSYSTRIRNLFRQSSLQQAWKMASKDRNNLCWQPQPSNVLRKRLERRHTGDVQTLIRWAFMLGSMPYCSPFSPNPSLPADFFTPVLNSCPNSKQGGTVGGRVSSRPPIPSLPPVPTDRLSLPPSSPFGGPGPQSPAVSNSMKQQHQAFEQNMMGQQYPPTSAPQDQATWQHLSNAPTGALPLPPGQQQQQQQQQQQMQQMQVNVAAGQPQSMAHDLDMPTPQSLDFGPYDLPPQGPPPPIPTQQQQQQHAAQQQQHAVQQQQQQAQQQQQDDVRSPSNPHPLAYYNGSGSLGPYPVLAEVIQESEHIVDPHGYHAMLTARPKTPGAVKKQHHHQQHHQQHQQHQQHHGGHLLNKKSMDSLSSLKNSLKANGSTGTIATKQEPDIEMGGTDMPLASPPLHHLKSPRHGAVDQQDMMVPNPNGFFDSMIYQL